MAPIRDTSFRYPGGRKALWGALGFVVTYALMVPVAVLGREAFISDITVDVHTLSGKPLSNYADLSQLSPWELAGQLLYNAQFVSTEIPIDVGGMTMQKGLNLILRAGIPFTVLLLVPMVVYAVTGALASREPERGKMRRQWQAVLQFTGVFPLVVVTIFVFGFGTEYGSAGPSLLWGPALAGFLYPAVGGYIGAKFAQRRTDDTASLSDHKGAWSS
jgi:hypothetical protein